MSIYPQAEMNDYPASLGITYGQKVESHSGCWLSKPEFPLRSLGILIPQGAELILILLSLPGIKPAPDPIA